MPRKTGEPLSKTKLAEKLREIGIIAAVRVPSEQQLLRGIAALTDGGIRAVELPYTVVRDAGWLIQQLKQNGLIVGVGAVTRSAQARQAGVFGADFITASVTTPDVVSACNEIDVPCTLSSLRVLFSVVAPLHISDAERLFGTAPQAFTNLRFARVNIIANR